MVRVVTEEMCGGRTVVMDAIRINAVWEWTRGHESNSPAASADSLACESRLRRPHSTGVFDIADVVRDVGTRSNNRRRCAGRKHERRRTGLPCELSSDRRTRARRCRTRSRVGCSVRESRYTEMRSAVGASSYLKIDFASVAWTPLVASTACVTCRSAASEQSM
jgi:hypothetical protein